MTSAEEWAKNYGDPSWEELDFTGWIRKIQADAIREAAYIVSLGHLSGAHKEVDHGHNMAIGCMKDNLERRAKEIEEPHRG